MKDIEDIKLNNVKVKTQNAIYTLDMKNSFINENLVLTPLYKPINIGNKIKAYNFFPYNDLRVECFCNKCNKKRIFNFENTRYHVIPYGVSMTSPTVDTVINGNNLDYFTLTAIADCKHELVMNFKIIDKNSIKIMKIGQYPSVYEMNEEISNKDFLKQLDKTDKEYYKSACALYSYNYCIGAMNYLRRIFENLLTETYKNNEEALNLKFEEFKKKKTDEKVKILKNYLPKILQENGFNNIYPIISNGVHNLSEDECQNIFLILKSAIDEILIEKMEEKEKAKRIKEISVNLQNICS